MLTNIKYGHDLITIDYQLRELRYLRNPAKHGPIAFVPLSHGDADGFRYLLEHDVAKFKEALRIDMRDRLNARVDVKRMVIIY